MSKFDELFPEGEEATKEVEEVAGEAVPIIEPPKPAKRRFIVYEQQIDKFNIKRSRVLLTPAVCDQCGLDLAALNKVDGEYEALDNDTKSRLRTAVVKHKKEYHTAADDLIVDEDEIPTQFLNRMG